MKHIVVKHDTEAAALAAELATGNYDAFSIGGIHFVREDGGVQAFLRVIAIQSQEIERLRRLVDSYEAPLPMMKDGHYEYLTDHRFNDNGICIRCGEDAEEWDAGCVESLVEDLHSLCTSQYADSLQRVLRIAQGSREMLSEVHLQRTDELLLKLSKFYAEFEFGKETTDAAQQDMAADS